VLILDYENPDHAVRARLELLARGRPITGARFWGTWLQHQPPAIGSDLLLQIAKQIKPLMIFDPFRYAHLAEENDSTEMMSVMQHLRSYAAAGAAVLVLHHPAKTEGSTGRGSSAIRGAVDVAFLQEINDETGLITLRSVKNRFGERFAVTIRPDFDEGTFEVTDSPAFLQRQEELDGLKQIIAESPGISKNRIHEKSGGKRARILRLLQEHDGTLWESRTDGSAIRYFPISQDRFPEQGTTLGTREPVSGNGTGSPVPFPKKGTGGNRVLPNQFPSGSPADDQEDLDVEF